MRRRRYISYEGNGISFFGRHFFGYCILLIFRPNFMLEYTSADSGFMNNFVDREVLKNERLEISSISSTFVFRLMKV